MCPTAPKNPLLITPNKRHQTDILGIKRRSRADWVGRVRRSTKTGLDDIVAKGSSSIDGGSLVLRSLGGSVVEAEVDERHRAKEARKDADADEAVLS